MPSRLKELMVKEAVTCYQDADSLVAISYEKVDAEGAEALRKEFREKGISLRMVRNRVTTHAMKELGRDAFGDVLSGPVAIITAEDVVETSKAAVDLAKDKKLKIKGGWVDGSFVDEAAVVQLSKLPSKKMLHAQIAGMAAQPLRGLVGMISAPGAALARVISAWNEERSDA